MGTEPTCVECSIQLTEIVTLGSPQDHASVRPDAMVRPCLVAAADDARFYFAGPVGGGELIRYGPDGAIEATLGRRGRGPGEFGRNLMVWEHDTSLVVIDNSNLRTVRLSRTGEVLATHRLPTRALSVAPLDDGGFVMHGRDLLSDDGSRTLFATVAATGEVTRHWGVPTADAEAREADQWLVTKSPRGGHWTASGWRYLVARWLPESEQAPAQTLERSAEWFPPDQVYRQDMYVRTPPPAWLTHLHEDDRGFLWTFVTLPDSRWKPGPAESPTPAWTTRTLDMMIEVFDLERGELVASERFDSVFAPTCAGDLIYTVSETSAGDTRLVLYEPRLVRR